VKLGNGLANRSSVAVPPSPRSLGGLGQAGAAAAALLGAPLFAGALALRPRWRVGLRQRLGLHDENPPGSVWIHAASVGEARAACRLIDRLVEREHGVYASAFSLSGREALRRWRPGVSCGLAPLDHPWCAEAALDRVEPAALVLVEAELWPSWIAAAARRRVPVVLVSGRVSDRSFGSYMRLERLVRPTLARLARIGARTERDAARFLQLGAPPERVSVTGDLKLDLQEEAHAVPPELETLLGRVPLLVAGSTHPGEEAAVLDAFDQLGSQGDGAALVLAPRHMERVPDVLRLLRRRRRVSRRRTRPGVGPLAAGEVLVLDTLGELQALYGRATAAFVGGTLTPVGGHNVLEPASVGCPVVVGPHVEGVRHAVELLRRCGAARRVTDAAELAGVLGGWLRDPDAAARCGAAGRRELGRHRGSVERSVSLVEAILTPAPGW